MNIEDFPLPKKVKDKLRKAGLESFEYIALTPAFILEGLELEGEKIWKTVENNLQTEKNYNFITALEHYKTYRLKIRYFTTGCRGLDGLLGGGIETGAITEFVGEFATGKTQIAHQLAVTVQLPSIKGGLESKSLYLDTEGTFRPERIIQIAEYRGLNPEKTLKNILYARAYTSEQQIHYVKILKDIIEDENIRLVIVDSLVNHFRSEYIGEEVYVRQRNLARHVKDLIYIAEKFNVAVVVTNQVLSVPETYLGMPLKPAGGNVIAHGCAHRVWLRKIDENRIAARLFDSPKNPEKEVLITITENGVLDYGK